MRYPIALLIALFVSASAPSNRRNRTSRRRPRRRRRARPSRNRFPRRRRRRAPAGRSAGRGRGRRNSAAAAGRYGAGAVADPIQSDRESPRGLPGLVPDRHLRGHMKTRYPKEFLFSLGALLAAIIVIQTIWAAWVRPNAQAVLAVQYESMRKDPNYVPEPLDVRDHEGLGAGELRHPDDLGAGDHRLQEPRDESRAGAAGSRPGARAGGHAHPAGGHARIRAPARIAAGRAAAVGDRARGKGGARRASARRAMSRTCRKRATPSARRRPSGSTRSCR